MEILEKGSDAMKKRERRIWIPVLLFFLVLVVFAGGIFWREIMRPKAVLTSALLEVFAQLENRFEKDPILVLARSCDPEGKYTADISLAMNQDPADTALYDMIVGLDLNAHQLSAEGTVEIGGQATDLSFYLGPKFAAVSSKEISDGANYGITFDTFTDDIQKVPLLNYLVDADLLAKWDTSLHTIQKQIKQEYLQPRIPASLREDLKKMLLGIAALPCDRQKAEIAINNIPLQCSKLDYKISGASLRSVLSRITGEPYNSDANAVISFYLHHDTIVRIALSGSVESGTFRYCLDLGLDPVSSPLFLQGSYGNGKEFSVTVTTGSEENHYVESWDIQAVTSGERKDHSFAFDWNLESGALKFCSGNSSVPLIVNFLESENGFQIGTDNLSSLLSGIYPEHKPFFPTNTSCTLRISKGAKVMVPSSYKNIDKWSMDDFLNLLGSVGYLIGIKLM